MKLAFLPSLGHNSPTPFDGQKIYGFFEAKEYYHNTIHDKKKRGKTCGIVDCCGRVGIDKALYRESCNNQK